MMKSYSSVYGPLGLVPLVLVWIYTSWLLVLLGAEIAHALQNLRLLEAEDRRQRDDEPINGLLAAQLLAAVAATHEVGGAGHPKERLVTEFGLTPDNVERVVARLKQRGLIAEVRGDINGYVPARPAATIRLDEVLAAFRSSDIEIAHGATAPAFVKLVGELEEGRRRRIAGVTIADLMPAGGAAPDDEPAAKPQVVRPETKKELDFRMATRWTGSRRWRGRSIRRRRPRWRPRRRALVAGDARARARDRGRVAARGLALFGRAGGQAVRRRRRARARAGDRAQPHRPRAARQHLVRATRRRAGACPGSTSRSTRRSSRRCWRRRRCCAPIARRTRKSTRSRCCCR